MDIRPVIDVHDEDDETSLEDVVDDAIWAAPCSPQSLQLALQRSSHTPRLPREVAVDELDDGWHDPRRHRAQVSTGGAGELNLVFAPVGLAHLGVRRGTLNSERI